MARKATPKGYWAERAERLLLAGERKGNDLVKTLTGFYEETTRRIQKDVDAFYGRYAAQGAISLQEAQRRLTPTELRGFQRDLADYYEAARRSGMGDEYRQYLRRLSGRAYISRQQALLAQIRSETEALAAREQAAFTDTLTNVYLDDYYRTIFDVQQGLGFAMDFARINTAVVEKIIRTPWLGDNYAGRIWANKTKLLAQLDQIVPRAFATGENSRVLGQQLAKRMGVARSAGERLVRTEVNHAANEATFDSYRACGVERYEYLATPDNRTSEICAALDGRRFRLADKKTGINYPPMHPNCRSTTVPYFPPDRADELLSHRAARDEDGNVYYVPADMRYKDWKKTQGRGIMKAQGGMLMKVTDAGIDKVPAFYSEVLGAGFGERLRREHQELLRYIRDDEPGTEALAYYTMGMERLTRYKGKPGANAVAITRFDIPHIAIHNHPDGGTFSPKDVFYFLSNENTELLTAVGNDGSLFWLEKTPFYNASAAVRKYLAVVAEIDSGTLDWEGVHQRMGVFLESLAEDGFSYGRG